jgi:hypothetical protein
MFLRAFSTKTMRSVFVFHDPLNFFEWGLDKNGSVQSLPSFGPMPSHPESQPPFMLMSLYLDISQRRRVDDPEVIPQAQKAAGIAREI